MTVPTAISVALQAVVAKAGTGSARPVLSAQLANTRSRPLPAVLSSAQTRQWVRPSQTDMLSKSTATSRAVGNRHCRKTGRGGTRTSAVQASPLQHRSGAGNPRGINSVQSVLGALEPSQVLRRVPTARRVALPDFHERGRPTVRMHEHVIPRSERLPQWFDVTNLRLLREFRQPKYQSQLERRILT